jgi:hypothetical protein
MRLMMKAAQEAITGGEIAPGTLQIHTMVLMGAVGEAFSNYLVWGQPKLTAKLADELIDAVFNGWTKGRKP